MEIAKSVQSPFLILKKLLEMIFFLLCPAYHKITGCNCLESSIHNVEKYNSNKYAEDRKYAVTNNSTAKICIVLYKLKGSRKKDVYDYSKNKI